MTNSAATDWSDHLDWDELLLYIRDGRVVPVVGNELLKVEVDGRLQTLESILARDLAGEFDIDVPTGQADLRLSTVAFKYLQEGRAARHLYPKVRVLLDRRKFELPPALRQLASIRAFPLILTTSFSFLVRDAIDRERFGNRRGTNVLAFTPYSSPGDLREPGNVTGSCVYHLFGLANSMPDYVITDEDLIEFLHGLQSDGRPQNLFDYLRGRHLLFLGCGYTKWLARFFIRTLRNERFASRNPQKSEIVIDDASRQDADLAIFLRQYDSHVFRSLRAEDFIAKLHRSLQDERPAPSRDPSRRPRREMPAEAVFLSYASEDADHARAVANALEEAGIDVWFDETRLAGGDDWEAVIQENILRCSIFVPFISKNTEAATEGYFRVEWKLALQRAMMMAPTRPFILPVVIDETPSNAPNVPSGFRRQQWIWLSATDGLEAVRDCIKANVRKLRAPQYAQS